MRPFDYAAPGSVEEALALLDRYGDGAVPLAGGQSLLILLRQGLVSPEVLVSLKRVAELATVSTDPDGALSLGGMVTYATAAGHPAVAGRAALVAAAASRVGSVHIRNLGTLGGSVCHADPAGDVPTVLLALDATLRTASPGGGRRHRAEDFFRGLFETCLEPGELLVAIDVPPQPRGATFAYRRFSFREGEYPLAVAACRLGWEGGRCSGARVAVGGGGLHPLRLGTLERLLRGAAPGEVAEVAAGTAPYEVLRPIPDVRGGQAWKARVVTDLVRRTVAEAAGRATGTVAPVG